ncbi:MAG: hypothetical protein B7X39_11130 [Lysobacterales bacterium 14-68-21]|jgi:hypothetical protein|nr:MAG: hypothetical protein B7X45_11165 [Xanthomonadales bacterium 15-68-25]OZB66046.1 MAG: hypothetical protein B7X39_11130 [Xanthomonadales bacterium 14-68-21]
MGTPDGGHCCRPGSPRRRHTHVVCPTRRFLPIRLRLFVGFVHQRLRQHEADVPDTVRQAMT